MERFFRWVSTVCLAAILLTGAATAQEFKKNVLTGGPSGTYIQIGRDISQIAGECGLTYTINESAGSLENFLGVRNRVNTQFGIVQSDVLEYLRTFSQNDPEIARAIFGVRIAFPLYNEEVHVLARREITSLNDLNGRKVAIGSENSGTFLTSSLVLDLAEVRPAERLTIDATASLAALLDGQIDAFFYVAGAPTKLFQTDEIDGSRFHLLPLTDSTLRAVYVESEIPAGTYPFQQEKVDLVAVKAVMMTFDYTPQRNAYHRESCKAVSDLVNIVLTNFDRLQTTGHPKWKTVELTDIPPGWDISECVNQGLDPEYALECRPPAVAQQARQSPMESEANAVYRQRICEAMGGC